ncbi:MAG: glycosyl hydrolase family 28 protein [Anaerolineales bacterium]
MQTSTMAIYNVRDYNATGRKEDDAKAAIQAAIEACAAAGGGQVYFPPGAYTTGTLHMRSHVRIVVEAGATIYASKEPAAFDKRALFFAQDVHHFALEGRGIVDGQGEYVWREMAHLDHYILSNQRLAEKNGVSLSRSFPTENSIGNLVLFIDCQDVAIQGLSFLHSPSWTMHLYHVDRLVIDGVYIYTNQRDGVWADGIDPDGCQDVRISNCTIETGDDAIVFYSGNSYGEARACENITITNCRLSSSSSALKFCDGNMKAVRNVVVDNCVITGSNRGLAFMVFDGGIIENVVLSNLVIECKRFDWFWWGDGDPIHFNLIQRHEIVPEMDRTNEPPVGIIRNVILSNIIAHGPGPSKIHGHVDSPLENITFHNVRLTVDSDPDAPWEKSPVAVTIENAHNVRLVDFEILWTEPSQKHWASALVADNVHDLLLDGLSVRQAPTATAAPAVVFKDVAGALVRHSRAQAGTGTFLQVEGNGTRDMVLARNDLRQAQTAWAAGDGAGQDVVVTEAG